MLATRSGTHRLRQQSGDKEDCANQGKHVGKRDGGQHKFQKPAEYCVIRDVIGVEARSNQSHCDPEVVGCCVENAI
jgi:hypothetical protein